MANVRLLVKNKPKQNYIVPKEFCSNFLSQIVSVEKEIPL